MFSYSLKSLFSKKVVTSLFTLALTVVLVVSMLAVNIFSQIKEGFFNSDGQYDIVIGKRGSSIGLVMSALYFSSDPVGTIPYSYYEKLKENKNLKIVIPMAMADNYKGANIVGTSQDFLMNKKLKEGRLFKNPFEAVVGYNVAKRFGLKLGDPLVSSHGVGKSGVEEHHSHPYKLVGILDETHTSYDNVVFTSVESIWEVHGIGHEHEDEEHSEEGTHEEKHRDEVAHDEEAESHEDEEHHEDGVSENRSEHEHHDDRALTAIVIRSGNFVEANKILVEYKNNEGVQAVNPTQTLRGLMENLDVSKQVAQLLCSIIIILSFILIAIMTVFMFESNKRDVQTLRFIGLKKSLISKFVLYQNITLISVGVIVSLALSRLALYVANEISSKMGIVLDVTKFYSEEILVLIGVSVVCVIPTFIQLRKIFKGGVV